MGSAKRYLIIFSFFCLTAMSCAKDDKCGIIIDKKIIENRYFFVFDSNDFNQFGAAGIDQNIYYVPDNRSSGEVSKDVYSKFKIGEEYCES